MAGHPFGSDELLIVGASVRAAAESAHRAGWRVMALDRYGDADLQCVANTQLVSHDSRGLLEAAATLNDAPWLYTGGLENRPALIDRLAKRRTVWGISGGALRSVGDPWRLAELAGAVGLPTAQLAADGHALPRDGSWLCKRRRSSGGGGVSVWNAQAPARKRGYYFQQRVEGRPWGAQFVAAHGQAVLLGITEQLIAPGWTHAPGFCYAGSVAPSSVPSLVVAQCEKLGGTLASQFDLRGLFGIDGVITPEGFVPLEVNPRYTSSMELLEHAAGVSTIGLHIAACRDGELPGEWQSLAAGAQRVYGKAIVYAARTTTILAEQTRRALDQRGEYPHPLWADIPAAGTRVAAGAPLLTVFAAAVTREEVLQQLRRRADDAERLFGLHQS